MLYSLVNSLEYQVNIRPGDLLGICQLHHAQASNCLPAKMANLQLLHFYYKLFKSTVFWLCSELTFFCVRAFVSYFFGSIITIPMLFEPMLCRPRRSRPAW